MKIRITKNLPVAPNVKPEIGSIHEVMRTEGREGKPVGYRHIHFIKIGNAYVGVFDNECEVVKGGEKE